MSCLRPLAAFFRAAFKMAIRPGNAASPSGFMAFNHPGQAAAAQKALLAAGLSPQIKAPPPGMREGCDMVLEFPLEEEAAYMAALAEKRLKPLLAMAAGGPLSAPESLFKRVDFRDHLMVSAANMKISITRKDGRIVNVSGGGCPDVPALANLLLGSLVTDPPPADEFRSLCSFSLSQARDEAERIFRADLPLLGPDQPRLPTPPASSLPWPKKRPLIRPKPWLVAGTLADPAETLAEGPFFWRDGQLFWNGRPIRPQRGTAALMAAYAITARALSLPPGRAVLAGDDGGGGGSRAIYSWLSPRIAENIWSGLSFHYLYPDSDSHGRLFINFEELSPRPILAADAGFMYAAKLCGQAPEYDLFTPDQGEMAYLADPKAQHPFYTRRALIQKEPDAALFAAAWQGGNAARAMLVKGRADHIVWRGRIVHRVDAPQAPAMEAMGGTGDTAAGIASALMAAGYSPIRAAALAAHINRRAGCSAAPDPAGDIADILPGLSKILAAFTGILPGGEAQNGFKVAGAGEHIQGGKGEGCETQGEEGGDIAD